MTARNRRVTDPYDRWCGGRELEPPVYPIRLLWRCGYVKPSAKPVKVIELGDGQIKVVGSCRIHQPMDQPNESYHESYEDALRRFVANGERDLKRAETELAGAKRRLASRKAMWTKHSESLPNAEVCHQGREKRS